MLMSHRLKHAITIFTAIVIAGCGGANVTMHNPTIPEPLIDKMPLTVAAKFPDVFDNYVHEEQVIGKQKWSIDLGDANRIFFTKLFDSMFSDFSVVSNDIDSQDLTVDAIIEPSIDAFEFSVPSQSQTDDFAVWIRYRIKIFDREGVQIANWPIAAYGKSRSSTFDRDDALRRAAVLAMRDAAALIILQMDKATGISKLSQAHLQERSLAEKLEDLAPQTTVAEETPDEPD
jgi:hypothetical protein